MLGTLTRTFRTLIRPMILILTACIVSAVCCVAAARLGPSATPWIAFFGIGASMRLKDATQLRYGWSWALALVFGTACVGWLVPGTRDVAIAGIVATVVSGIADTLILEISGSIVASDAVGALVDTLVFLRLAFGGGPYLAQFGAKFFGARVWRLLTSEPPTEGTGCRRIGCLLYQSIPGYLQRWVLDLRWLQLCVHRFLAPDPMTEWHNHPRNGVFYPVLGGYDEQTLSGTRSIRSLNVIARSTFHRIARLHRTPTWTIGIFVGSPMPWGFWTPVSGFQSWEKRLND